MPRISPPMPARAMNPALNVDAVADADSVDVPTVSAPVDVDFHRGSNKQSRLSSRGFQK